MSKMVVQMQTQLKRTSGDIFLFALKLISGVVLGLTFALIMQVVLGHAEGENLIAFVFVMIVTTAVFMRLARSWSTTVVLVFDLICVLLGMLLRLYIMVAPDV